MTLDDIQRLVGKPFESPITKSLDLALFDAQGNIKGLTRDGRNEHHRYDYVTAENAIKACRDALESKRLRWELVISETRRSVTSTETATEKQRSVPGAVAERVCVFRVGHIDTGEYRMYLQSVPIVPENGRPPDKASAAAETMGWKYCARGILALPWQDEDGGKPIEPCSRDDRNYKPPAPPRQDGAPSDEADTDNGDGTRTVIGVISEHKLATAKNGKVYAQFTIGDYKLSSFESTESTERVAILTAFEQRTPVRVVIKRKGNYWNLVEISPAGGESSAPAAASPSVPFIEVGKIMLGGPGKMREVGGTKWWEYASDMNVQLITRSADVAGGIDREFEATAPGELRQFNTRTQKTPKGVFEILWAEPTVGTAAENVPF